MITKNQDKVAQYKSGKEKLFGYFVGEVMKISKGKANPQLVNKILKKKLPLNKMGSNLVITKEIENYINNHSLELTTVQKEKNFIQ
ncbi:MAG: hypothetical protein CM1200mP5_6820 [Candidatus Pelagibacterales bacterium]|nr:MAG: hypothetical protein CM1200mP5_6820 [Pelagibacterales bacterium]